MDQRWTEAGRQAERKRRSQVLGLLALILACAGIWAHSQRDPTAPPQRLIGTKEVDGERTIDTNPFALAAPQDASPNTTIPGDLLPGGSDDPPIGGSTQSTAANAPQITIPTQLRIQPTATIESLCGSTSSIASYFNLTTNPSLDARQLTSQLQANLLKWIDLAPPAYKDDLIAIKKAADDAIAVLAASDWRGTDPAFRAKLSAIQKGLAPYQGFSGNFQRLIEIDQRQCNSEQQGGG